MSTAPPAEGSGMVAMLGIVVLGTGVLTICGALGLWLIGPWVVKLVYKSGDVSGAMKLIPWYACAMVPLPTR